MNSLIINGNETMPFISFNAETGILEMRGVAIPEDIHELVIPLREWISDYGKQPKSATELILYFEYLNTSASKMVYEVCDKVSDLHGVENANVKITWRYNRGDVEMLELAEEILESFLCLKEIEAVEEFI